MVARCVLSFLLEVFGLCKLIGFEIEIVGID